MTDDHLLIMLNKRSYHSKIRPLQAANTKKRILAAAEKLFQAKGLEQVKIEDLAKAANVSASTIYAQFKSKCGILRALMDEALPAEQFKQLVEQSKAEKSAKKRLEITAKITRQLYDAERSKMAIIRGSSMLSSELKAVEKTNETRRYRRQKATIETMMKANDLTAGITLSKARDILWAFTGRDMYRLFVIEKAWKPDDYEKWLAQLLIKTLIRDS
ncbi:MAG: helix-turn-helix domain-containing protein [Pseudomonadota bacterium]